MRADAHAEARRRLEETMEAERLRRLDNMKARAARAERNKEARDEAKREEMKEKRVAEEERIHLFDERQKAVADFWKINNKFKEVKQRNKLAAQEAAQRELEAALQAKIQRKKSMDDERRRAMLAKARMKGAAQKILFGRKALGLLKKAGSERTLRREEAIEPMDFGNGPSAVIKDPIREKLEMEIDVFLKKEKDIVAQKRQDLYCRVGKGLSLH